VNRSSSQRIVANETHISSLDKLESELRVLPSLPILRCGAVALANEEWLAPTVNGSDTSAVKRSKGTQERIIFIRRPLAR